MKIVVYGLGIIGASICASLKRAGHIIYGRNRSQEPIDYALSHGMIDGVAGSYEGADVVFLALPPKVAIRELDCGEFPASCIVADICGVKEPLERTYFSKDRNFRYVGLHPMAGKETTGIRSASEKLFDGANLVISVNPKTDPDALSCIRSLAADMRFGRIVECSASEHDKMIALTSQLAHVVSGCYIVNPLTERARGFTGGSYQDMTRVAPMDDVWCELFLFNRGNLMREIEGLCDRLAAYREALEAEDADALLKLIREGKSYFERFFCGER